MKIDPSATPQVRRRYSSALERDITELALGTWGLSGDGYGPVETSVRDAVIDRALELGIRVFDTADVYANGEMEKTLGTRLQAYPDAVIVTRVGTTREQHIGKRFEPDYLREAVQRSRDRLGRPIDLCLLHNPDAMTIERQRVSTVFQEFREQGILAAWGVSAGSRGVAMAALDQGVDVLSVPYNLFWSRDLQAIASEVSMRSVTVLAHSVLAYGLLAAEWGADRMFDKADHRQQRWSSELFSARLRQLSVVRDLVGGPVLTPRAAALRFVLSNSLITSALLGPRTVAQLEQLVEEAGDGPPYLASDTLARLPAKLVAAGVHT